MKVLILASVLFVVRVGCAPLGASTIPSIPSDQALNFMKRFGYIEDDAGQSEALYREEAIKEIIKSVQKFGAIPQTGVIDNETLNLMKSPRCGVPDVVKNKRAKRYIVGSEGWKKRNLTYFVANWSPKLSEEIVADSIQRALNGWGKYGRLKFHRALDPNADIIVAFGRGPHGDSYPFDGPGSILAHAFFPYDFDHYGGDIHFDDDENWAVNPAEYDDGIDFFTVAVHELGHSLGLAHSHVSTSIMFPYYRNTLQHFALDYDDILGMYELYIKRHLDGDDLPPLGQNPTDSDYEDEFATDPPTTRRASTVTPEITTVSYVGDTETVDEHKKHTKEWSATPTTVSPIPNICDGHFDAVATLRDELFVFKKKFVWRLKKWREIEYGYPVPIHQMFPLPETVQTIDAAYQRHDGVIVLFTGNHYWLYDGDRFVENSPKNLTEYGLPQELDKVDAVHVWAKNGKTYIFKNERFWRYNETSRLMDADYPKHIERWRGVPGYLDAATTWKDDYTYFFKGKLFWKFDNDWVIVMDSSPLPAPQTWLGCPEEETD